MSWAAKPSILPMDIPTGAQWKAVLDQIDALTTPRACVARRNAAQSITSGGSPTSVSLDTEVYDSASMFAPTSTDITLNAAGLWVVQLGGTWAVNGTGERMVLGFINGTELDGGGTTSSTSSAANTFRQAASFLYYTAATTDVLTMRVFQTSGAGLNFTGRASAILLSS